jgi:hypothetical protein
LANQDVQIGNSGLQESCRDDLLMCLVVTQKMQNFAVRQITTA